MTAALRLSLVAALALAAAAPAARAADPVPTTTAVSCSPAPATVGRASSCTATVAPEGPGFPTGSVSFSSDDPGAAFTTGNTCALAALTGASLCKVSYVPARAGAATLTSLYAGDETYAASEGTGVLQVTDPPAAAKRKCRRAKKGGALAAKKKKCRKKKRK